MELSENASVRLIEGIKQKIRITQYQAVLGANEYLIKLYWEIGQDLNGSVSYGSKFIDELAKEIKKSFPTK